MQTDEHSYLNSNHDYLNNKNFETVSSDSGDDYDMRNTKNKKQKTNENQNEKSVRISQAGVIEKLFGNSFQLAGSVSVNSNVNQPIIKCNHPNCQNSHHN